MRMKFLLLIMVLVAILLSGCGARVEESADVSATESVLDEIMQSTVVPTEAMTMPEVTQVPTEAPTVPPTEPPTEPVAEMIHDSLRVLIDGFDNSAYLVDDNNWSKERVMPNQRLSLTSEVPFGGIYIEWDRIPELYSIVWDGGSVACGQNGFLHEFIRLPVAVNEVTFEFTSADMQVLTGIRIYTEGVAPDDVQVWLPPCEEADILVFPTHSDDDTLFFGPLISYYAVERQLRVQTAFMVEHHGYPERCHERLNGLWDMGVRHYPVLGTAPDTATLSMSNAMRYYESSNIEQWQVEHIRRFKPMVVVGHDLNGEYGNGGHKVNAHFLVRAIESAADPMQFTESAEQYGIWDTPKLYLHLYEENEIILDVDTPLENDPEGRTPFQLAQAGYACHLSQHQYGYSVQYGRSRAYDCRPFGLYRTLVGYDTVADIMENIDVQAWRNPEN